jgi:hypothetical protein
MMARRPALTDAGVTRPSLAVVPLSEPMPATHASRPPARQGKSMIAAYIDPALARQLRHAAVDGGTTLQAIMEQALDLWCRERGLPRIASQPGNRRPSA